MILVCVLFGTLFGVVSFRLFFVREFFLGFMCLCCAGIMFSGVAYILTL